MLNSATNAPRGQKSGFTLIELLAVVAIIAVLAALLFPTVGSIRESGKRTTCLSHMRELANVVFQYSADNGNRVLPAASGNNAWMNDSVWYELLDADGYLAANPNNPKNSPADVWNGKRNSIMSCPNRDSAPFSYWVGQKHAVHYSVNQHPGFYNRVNTSAGGWPTLAQVTRPGRTFLLAEANFPIGYPNGDNFVYPHARNGKKEADGEGQNLVFYDGHAEYFKGRLPVLWAGDFGYVPYETITQEDSFPWF